MIENVPNLTRLRAVQHDFNQIISNYEVKKVNELIKNME